MVIYVKHFLLTRINLIKIGSSREKLVEYLHETVYKAIVEEISLKIAKGLAGSDFINQIQKVINV